MYLWVYGLGTDQGIKYDNGTGWKTAPLPTGVSSTIGYCSSTVGKNKVAWAYFDTYNAFTDIGDASVSLYSHVISLRIKLDRPKNMN